MGRFKEALNNATMKALDALSLSLVSTSSDATRILWEILSDTTINPGTRVRAIEVLLANMQKMRELISLESRVKILEEVVNQQVKNV